MQGPSRGEQALPHQSSAAAAQASGQQPSQTRREGQRCRLMQDHPTTDPSSVTKTWTLSERPVTRARLWVPLHPDLKAIMDAGPSQHLTFIVTEHGKPYSTGKAFGA